MKATKGAHRGNITRSRVSEGIDGKEMPSVYILKVLPALPLLTAEEEVELAKADRARALRRAHLVWRCHRR